MPSAVMKLQEKGSQPGYQLSSSASGNTGVCAGMRGVDLSCLLLSPIAAGFLMTYGGMQTAILVIALWNLAAWIPECYLLYVAQQASAALR